MKAQIEMTKEEILFVLDALDTKAQRILKRVLLVEKNYNSPYDIRNYRQYVNYMKDTQALRMLESLNDRLLEAHKQ